MIESLEKRTLLAGHLVSHVEGGTLYLEGDRNHNAITLDNENLEPGEVRVSGDNHTHIDGINGVVFGKIKNVHIRLNGGNDRVVVRGLTIERDLRIDVGTGDDQVFLNNIHVKRQLSIKAGRGNDEVGIGGSTIASRSTLELGHGKDKIGLLATTFSGHAIIDSGQGKDSVALGNAVFTAGRKLDADGKKDALTARSISRNYDFRNGANGWQAGFADYFDGMENGMFQLESGLRTLPPELGVNGTGFMLAGINRSDDMFMFLKRRLGKADGIVANQTYQVHFELTMASNATGGVTGIGGAPGEAVTIKAGATAVEPKRVPYGTTPSGMNVDIGDQNVDGPAATVAGNIANGPPSDGGVIGGPLGPLAIDTPLPDDGEPNVDPVEPYKRIERTHTHTYLVKAGTDGQLWLLVGTDSGFEGLTRLYYQQIKVTLNPVGDPTKNA